MKTFIGLVLLAVLCQVHCESTRCELKGGHHVVEHSGRDLAMKVPCKFNMVDQTCGGYKVTVSPGERFLYPTYVIRNVWLHVERASDATQFFEGRSDNRVAGKYIIAKALKKPERPLFNQKGGSLTLDELFNVTYTRSDVTLTEKGGDFSITLGPYDFAGGKARDSRLVFECHRDSVPVAYPEQFCGTVGGKEIKDRTGLLFKNKKRIDLTTMFDVFNATRNIVQTDEQCQRATSIFTEECDSDEKRVEAIKMCHLILDSTGHTTCIIKYEKNPMETFTNCLKYVCSGYKDKDACRKVGEGIDMCREFPVLTPHIKDCYNDYYLAEDNPYLNNEEAAVTL